MLSLAIRSATVASLLRGETQFWPGMLVRADSPRTSEDASDAPYRPRFVISTEGAATDDFVVRQFWDFARAQDQGGPGIPCLFNHNPNDFLGQWGGFAVEGQPGAGARSSGMIQFDEEEMPQLRARQVRRGSISACSVGWIPGEMVRRSSLKEDDPLYREADEDECGQPTEGFVMGSATKPNRLVEVSLTPTPADPGARALGRIAHATEQFGAIARGERVSGIDLGGVLLALRGVPSIRTYAATAVLDEAAANPDFRRRLAAILNQKDEPTARTTTPTLGALLRGRS